MYVNLPTGIPEVDQELDRLAGELRAAVFAFVVLQELNAEPTKKTEGMTVLADGTNWNPGSGAGVYTYYGGSWNKLG